MPFQVLVDRGDGYSKQFGDKRLRHPNILMLETALDARAPVLRLIENQLTGRHARVGVVAHFAPPFTMSPSKPSVSFSNARMSELFSGFGSEGFASGTAARVVK
jgi:hypothetical protein